MDNALSSLAIWEWLLSHSATVDLPFSRVMTTGNGPIGEFAFDEFLRKHGVEPHYVSDHLETFIVGREGWEAEELDDLLAGRRGQMLRVYSQEMLFAYLLTGQDPHHSPELLPSFAHGHEALEYLQDTGFPWPTTLIVPSRHPNAFSLEGSPEKSVLAVMGYRAGTRGLHVKERQAVLKLAYEGELPFVDSEAHMATWGTRGSAQRLQKIANSLASTVRLQKRNETRDFGLAISERETDLKWLKQTYYDGRYDFFWPGTTK